MAKAKEKKPQREGWGGVPITFSAYISCALDDELRKRESAEPDTPKDIVVDLLTRTVSRQGLRFEPLDRLNRGAPGSPTKSKRCRKKLTAQNESYGLELGKRISAHRTCRRFAF